MKVGNRAKEAVKICFVSSWFPSKVNPHCTPFVPALVKRFKKTGFEVTIITTREKEEPTFDMKSEGIHGSIPVYRINRHVPLFQMFRLVDKLRPDVVHVHAPNFFSSFAVVVGKILVLFICRLELCCRYVNVWRGNTLIILGSPRIIIE